MPVIRFLDADDTTASYSGRNEERIGVADGGGARLLDGLGPDVMIPVIVDRTAAAAVPGGCQQLCFPRSVTLDIGYHQRTKQLKRIVYFNLVLEDFDTNSTKTDYELKLSK